MIDVLLATYNGAKHLPELLLSLERQTCPEWRLLVRDDGSTDGSLSLIEEWSKHRPQPVFILPGGGRLGPRGNFAALLASSDAPYFMFCDQDDVWLPHKIALLHRAVLDAEARRGTKTPILAHSDLVVVDDQLRELNRSFWEQQGTSPASPHSDHTLLLQNRVTGCAVLGNASLRDAAMPIPNEAVMHDWWTALVASFTGELLEITTPTVLYRQHEMNTIGAKGWRAADLVRRLLNDPSAAVQRTRSVIQKTQRQAGAFADIFAGRIDAQVIDICREYSILSGKGFLERKVFLARRRLWPANRLRAAIFLCFV